MKRPDHLTRGILRPQPKRAPTWGVIALLTFLAAGVCWSLLALTCF